jgi:competence protein ComFC
MYRARTLWTSCYNATLDWIYPPQCALCTRIGSPSVCDICASEMTPLEPLSEESADKVLSFRLAAYSYENRASQAVKRLKYSRATSLALFMADAVASIANETDVASDRIVVPVPIHWTRRSVRGFNQAEMLCEAFPAETVRRDILYRAKATAPQASLKAEQRRVNLVNAFRVRGKLDGQRILLVDDVVTTGHTARECAKVLMEAGAIEVGLVTFAAEL